MASFVQTQHVGLGGLPSISLRQWARTRRRFCRSSYRRFYHELSYTKNDLNPRKVLSYLQDGSALPPKVPNDGKHSDCWCLVQMLAAPWNPADENTVQGRYPPPKHLFFSLRQSTYFTAPSNTPRFVAGSEGVGRVVEKRNEDSRLQVGDFVALGLPGLGSLRSRLWCPSKALLKLNWENQNNKFSIPQWSTLLQLGGTAYKLLDDNLVKGVGEHDVVVVVQNAAQANVGFFVQQLLPLLFSQQLNVLIQVVRENKKNQFNNTTVKTRSSDVQNTHQSVVVTEDELETAASDGGQNAMWSLIQERYKDATMAQFIPRPVLALDAVGGASGSRLFSLLGSSSTLVNYGALSQEPLHVPPPHLIFRNKTVKGHWHSRYMERASLAEKQTLLDQLVQWVELGHLVLPPVRTASLPEYQEAMTTTTATSVDSPAVGAGDISLWPSRPKLVFDLLEKGEESFP